MKYRERCKTSDGDEQKTPMKVFNSAQTHGKMTMHCRTVREQKGQLSNALFAVLGLLQLQLSPLVATVESAKMMMIRSCHSIIATLCQDSYPDAIAMGQIIKKQFTIALQQCNVFTMCSDRATAESVCATFCNVSYVVKL